MDYINQTIGKYTITRKIGEGGMASVYEGVHEKLGTKVAIKFLSPILARNPKLRQRFENEANFMASLSHPHITRVLDVEEKDDTLAIIMELLEGEDLDGRVKRTGPLSSTEVKMLFTQVLNAFDYAHSKGIVHRDIKPANIFIDKNNQVKILDFGIAKLFGTGNEMTQTGTQMGTPVYMSPEQVKGEKSIDHRADIYALGVTLYFTLTGKAPYESAEESSFEIFTKIVNEPIPSLSDNPTFDAIIQKAASKDRDARYQAVDEMRKELDTSDNSQLKTAAPISEKTVIENINLAAPISDKTITDNKASDNEAPTSVSENNKVSSSSEKQILPKKIVLAIAVGIGIIGIIGLIFIKSNMHGASSEAYGDATSEVTDNTSDVETVASDNNIMDTTYNNQPVSIDSPSKKITPKEKKNNKQIEAVKPLPILQVETTTISKSSGCKVNIGFGGDSHFAGTEYVVIGGRIVDNNFSFNGNYIPASCVKAVRIGTKVGVEVFYTRNGVRSTVPSVGILKVTN